MTTRAQVDAARGEILACSDAQLERRTAEVWCARAMAAYELAAERRCVRWLARATGYHLEAFEHAAGVSAEFLAHVEHALSQCKDMAIGSFEARGF